VKATALSSNTFTIVRAQDNTSAGTWSVGDIVELRLTSALLQDVIDQATVEGIKTNFQYIPTSNQTAFDGADNSGDTMIINDAELVNVYMNGVRLVQGSDYTVSSSNNRITLSTGATTADVIDIEVFGNFVSQSGAAVSITGGAIAGTAITTGSINNTPVGATQANTVAATTLTANSLAVDNITIDGNEIDVGSGNLTLDVAGDIILDADGGDIVFKDGGTHFGSIYQNSNNLLIYSAVADADMLFQGNDSDGSNPFTALTLDFSAGGNATFSGSVGIGTVPATKFDVMAAGVNQWYIRNSDSSAQNNAIVSLRTGGYSNIALDGATVDLKIAGSSKVHLDSSGNATFSGSVTADGLDLGATTDAASVSTTASDYQLQLGAANSTTGDIGQNISFDFSGVTTASINSYDAGASSATGLAFFTGTSSTLRRFLDIGSGGDISFYENTGTTPKFFWDASAESLGIGTSSPETKLHISGGDPSIRLQAGASADARIDFEDSGGTVRWYSGYDVDTGNLVLAADESGFGSSNIILMNDSGNVGIGTTNPVAQLAVGAAGRRIEIAGSDGVIRGYDRTASWANIDFEAAGYTFDASGSLALTIDGSGNLLIGKNAANNGIAGVEASTAAFNATVSGDTVSRLNRLSGFGEILRLQKDTATAGRIGAASGPVMYAVFNDATSNNVAALKGASAGILPSTNAGADKDATMNLGSSSARFNNLFLSSTAIVGSGSAGVGGTPADVNGTEIGKGYINLNRDDTASAAQIQFGKNGAVAGSIVTTTSTTYNTTSDRRLKTDIETITDATDKLMAMNPVSHKWKADPEADAVHGFIAQEMMEIVPEAVSGDPEGEEMMSMDYGRITPVIVAALQAATKEIEKLKIKIEQLEANQYG